MGKVVINRNGKTTVIENGKERDLKKGDMDNFDVVINVAPETFTLETATSITSSSPSPPSATATTEI
ncbi:hypothetical protein ACIA49_21840 [Kribbella sp. NPDC051587]|uniref:hypothetical protein n=1 Tax=Kribbella sp. NPDC051587 TaxID=3364119 RepID=UPI00379F3434